jgi:hypothetical protein
VKKHAFFDDFEKTLTEPGAFQKLQDRCDLTSCLASIWMTNATMFNLSSTLMTASPDFRVRACHITATPTLCNCPYSLATSAPNFHFNLNDVRYIP